MLRILVICSVELALLAAPAATSSQEVATPAEPSTPASRGMHRRATPRPPTSTTVFKLHHASCDDIAVTLGRAFSAVAIPDRRTNSVIMSAPESELAAARALLEKLDQPSTDPTASDVLIVPAKYRRAQALADQIRQVLPGRDLRVAADEARASILLRGTDSALEAASSILAQLDTPAASVTLEFAFFRAYRDHDKNHFDAVIPPDLADVAKELRRFGAVEFLARLSTIAVEHEDFKIEGGILEDLVTMVKGELISVADDGAVRLEMDAFLRLEKAPSPGPKDKAQRRGPMPTFELGTIVQTRRGDYVILGSAPTGWKPGESAILVLHVRP